MTLALYALGALVALGLLIRIVRRRRRAAVRAAPPVLLYPRRSADASVPPVPAFSLDVEPPRPRLLLPSDGRAGMLLWAPATNGTVQLLPGWLEPAAGGTEEIRFVRTPGVTRFTLGRARGDTREHIQLRAPSVSRMHAFMKFDRGVWRIGVLSQTNPVLVNHEALGSEEERVLEDGDRIELGEAAFVFRHPVKPRRQAGET